MKTAEYPILFRGDTEDFTTNGMGRLSEAESCLVTEALNGGYECVLTYPKNGRHAADIRQKRFLYMKPNEKSNKQAFRIYKIEETSDGEKMVVRGQHRSYDLSGYPVKPFTAEGISPSLQGLSSNIMLFKTSHQGHSGLGNPYTFWTNITNTTSKFKLTEPRSVRACLGGVEGSFIQLFKAELEFDGTTVKLWKSHGRGTDNGVTIRYGKNLEKFVNVRTTESAYSGVLAYYKNDKTVIYGDIRRATWGLDEDKVDGNLSFPASRIFMLDASSDFTAQEGETQTNPTKAQLNARADEYIEDNNIGVPYIDTVTVSFVPLWETEEYKDVAVLEQVSLGDYVTVKYGRFDFKTRMVEYTYDTIKGRYTSCTLGTKQASFSNTIQQVAGTGSSTVSNAYASQEDIETAIAEFKADPIFDANVAVVSGQVATEFGFKHTGSFANQQYYASGFVTSGGNTAVIYVHGGTTAWGNTNITNLVASLRTATGGYLGGAENTNLTSYISQQTFHENQNMMEIRLTNSSGWGVTNNTPVNGLITIGYTIT